MKTWMTIGAAALQVLVLAWMAGERELILHAGRTVYLRTAPIDPRDPFRGDFVHLDYEISHATSNQVRGGLSLPPSADAQGSQEIMVYAALKLDGDLASLDYVSDRKPADAEVVLRGYAQRQGRPGLDIRYGLEAYFVEQGQGRVLERVRSVGGIQVPLEMAVAVSGSGKSVLKDHRWSPIGIGLALSNETRTVTNDFGNRIVTNRFPVVVTATVTLLNASSNDLAVVDLPGGQSLELAADTLRGWAHNPWNWTGAGRTRPAPTDADVQVLKPGETHAFRVDLGNPDWFVSRSNEPPRTVSGLAAWSDRFRLWYSPPPEEACRQLQRAGLIWHGRLPSRAFTGGGQVD